MKTNPFERKKKNSFTLIQLGLKVDKKIINPRFLWYFVISQSNRSEPYGGMSDLRVAVMVLLFREWICRSDFDAQFIGRKADACREICQSVWVHKIFRARKPPSEYHHLYDQYVMSIILEDWDKTRFWLQLCWKIYFKRSNSWLLNLVTGQPPSD